MIQEFTREPNVDGSLNFIPSENPNLDAGRFDVFDCLPNIFLKLVLDGCRSDKFKIYLNFLSQFG
jgi:hypothetical protein